MSTQTSAPSSTAGAGERSSLRRLYLGRGVLAVVWALAFAKAHGDLDAAAITLLVAYPLIDAVSSLIDHRATPDGSERRVIAFNGVLSTLAAVALGFMRQPAAWRRCCMCSAPGRSSPVPPRWSWECGGAAPSWASSGRP